MRKIYILALMSSSVILCGCASSSDEIAADYVSPYTYQDYSCPQLAAEIERIGARVHQVAGSVDSASTNDKVATGVGLVLFWPALFMIKGNGAEQAELARLKGEYDATNEAMIQHNCNAPSGGNANVAAVAPARATWTPAAPQPAFQTWKPAGANTVRVQEKDTRARSAITISGAATSQ